MPKTQHTPTVSLIEAAEAFAIAIQTSDAWHRWEAAQGGANRDPQLIEGRKRLAELSARFREERSRGKGLPGPELEEMLRLQTFLQDSPVAREQDAAAQELVAFLQDANSMLSDSLGIDFATNAVRRGGGCCG